MTVLGQPRPTHLTLLDIKFSRKMPRIFSLCHTSFDTLFAQKVMENAKIWLYLKINISPLHYYNTKNGLKMSRKTRWIAAIIICQTAVWWWLGPLQCNIICIHTLYVVYLHMYVYILSSPQFSHNIIYKHKDKHVGTMSFQPWKRICWERPFLSYYCCTLEYFVIA